MELQFNKTVIPCMRPGAQKMQTQEQTQEVRLTDDMPDIGTVLGSWGQVVIRGKEWRSSGAGVSGGVMAWVLYMPEDGSEPRCLETWLPFQLKWDVPDTQRDGTVHAVPMLRSVDARSLSARKMMVRANVGMVGQVLVPEDMELYTPGELPEDVQVWKKSYPILLPKEAGEKAFNFEESLSLPSNAPQLSKVIRYSLQPNLTESKIVADKLVMRGTANVNLTYLSTDGKLYSRDFEVPFSQYAELEREYDSGAFARIDLAVTLLELEQKEEENLDLKAGITAQYIIFDRQVMELIEDAYSPKRTVTPQMMRLQMPALLDVHKETVHAQLPAGGDAVQIAHVSFYPDHPQTYHQDDMVNADLKGDFCVLGYDEEGKLQSNVIPWEKQWSIGADEDAGVELTLQPTGEVCGDPGNCSAEMLLQAYTSAEQGLPAATGLALGDFKEPDPGRPSLVLRRAGQNTLWEIAKQTGSTMEAIVKANALEGDPDPSQMLLIPIA